MPNPATGSSLLLALGLEPEYGVPGGGLIGYRSRLPVKAGLAGTETASGAVNQSGFLEKGIPGVKGGGFEFPLPLRVGELLEFLEHIFGSVAKTLLETGVYRYTFTPVAAGVDTSFYALYSTAPVEHEWQYGIKFGSIDCDLNDNVEVPVVIKGLVGHGTRLGAAVADGANTGTYTKGPFLRGPLADRTAGDVHVTVTQVVGGLKYKVEQSAAAPTFPGAAVDVVLDPETSRAVWQNVQGHDGLDLGLWSENKDPLEIIWPGMAADHAALAVGDKFTFPVAWSDPAVPFLSGHQRFTSAHWVVRLRNVGAPAWATKPVNTGKLSIEKAVTADRGNNSRYAFGLIREGKFMSTIELQRKYVDAFFAEKLERHDRLEGQLLFEGQQLGSGLYREGMTLTFASLRIDSDDRTPASDKAIEEKVKLSAETTDAGDPPLIVEVITPRNWTPTV